MKMRSVVVAVVLAALVATAQPAAAADAGLEIASENDTQAELQSATSLTDLFVNDGAARLYGATGTTATTDADDSTGTGFNGEFGIEITPNIDISGVTVSVSANTDSGLPVELQTASGTVLDSTTASGGSARLDAKLEAGTTYRVVAVASNSNIGLDSDPTFPYTSSDVDIVGGVFSGSSSTDRYAFDSVTSLTYADNGTGGQYIGSNHSADRVAEGFVNLDVSGTNATVEWQGWDGSSWTTLTSNTYASSGNKTASLSSAYETYRVNVTFAGSSGATGAVLSEGVLFDAATPSASGFTPADGAQVNNSSVQFGVNVSDADFATAQGDEVNATLYVDGSEVGSDTVTSNATATVTHSLSTGGEHTYYWELNDSYGDSTTTTVKTVSAPASLTIREEQNPSELVNNTTVTVRFFGDSDTVVERSVTNGTVNLTGLPVGQTFVVTAEAESGYYYRRIVLDSIYEQSTIYLLNESEPSAQVIFELDDRTGRFDASTTQLFIEAAIQRDFDGDGLNETRYQVIAGDNFGGAQSFPARLADAERYRLRIVNDEGETRVLGSYTTAGDAREILPVGEVSLGREADTGRAATARLQTSDGQANIRLVYFDTAENTSELTVTVRDGNGSVVYGPVTTTGTFGGYVETVPLANHSDGETYNVTIEGVRGGESFTISRTVGGVGPITDGWDIDSQLLAILASILSLALSGAVAIQDPPAAMIVLVASVGFSAALGFLTVDPLLLTFGGGLALLANAGRVR